MNIRRLTPGMIDSLMEIHERELLGQEMSCTEVKHIKGLYLRGLIRMKLFKNKKGKYYMGFYVTDAGRAYLERIASS